jgi:transposase
VAVIVRRQLRRRQVLALFGRLSPCLIGMEACATSHHWARELAKLGHKVRLMPPRDVKPYPRPRPSAEPPEGAVPVPERLWKVAPG